MVLNLSNLLVIKERDTKLLLCWPEGDQDLCSVTVDRSLLSMSKTKVIPSESQVLDALQLKLGCFKCIGQCGEMGICCFCFAVSFFAGWFLCSFLSFSCVLSLLAFCCLFFVSLCVSLLRFCFFLFFFVFFLCVFGVLFVCLFTVFIYLVVVAVAVCGDGGGGGIFNMSCVEPIYTRTSK